MFLPSVVKELNKEIQKTTTATHKLYFCIEPLDLDVKNEWVVLCQVDFSKNEREPTILVLVLKFFFLVVN